MRCLGVWGRDATIRRVQIRPRTRRPPLGWSADKPGDWGRIAIQHPGSGQADLARAQRPAPPTDQGDQGGAAVGSPERGMADQHPVGEEAPEAYSPSDRLPTETAIEVPLSAAAAGTPLGPVVRRRDDASASRSPMGHCELAWLVQTPTPRSPALRPRGRIEGPQRARLGE
jgi:hypothetical protein